MSSHSTTRTTRSSTKSRKGGPLVVASGLETIDAITPDWSSTLTSHLDDLGLTIHNAELKDILDSTRSVSASTSPVLIVLEPNESDKHINKLLDLLSETLTPALVLIDPQHAMIQDFMRSEGVLCETYDLDPHDASIMIRTLSHRQPALHRLSTDLRISEMTIHGVQTEVNKLHDELQNAASIQRQYLPESDPHINGVDLGVIYRPASYVSGDIYDIAQLDEDRSAFFLADAVGHGVPAALMTMVITQGLRKLDGSGSNAKIVEPAEALRRLNNTMSKSAADGARFATAMYAVYDKSKHEVTIAGAGHPPAMLVRAHTHETEMIDSQGPLLGIFAGVEFEQTTIALEPGDVLVFYSDGFEVAFPNQSDDEHERKRPTQTYINRLSDAGHDHTKLSESIKFLEDNLDHQMGSLHQPDDITAIFIAPSSDRSVATQELVNELNHDHDPVHE